MDTDLLSIYLNDHRAGAIAGYELAKRAASSNVGTPFGAFLEGFIAELETDLARLEEIMDRLGIKRDRLKEWAGWTAEKIGRMKMNGQLSGYSPLSRVIEFEGLVLGVTGKLSLWQNLKEVCAADERLAAVDLEDLIRRAKEQRDGLEEHRLEAAALAFSES